MVISAAPIMPPQIPGFVHAGISIAINKIPFNQAVKSIFRGSVRSKENIDDVILQLIYF